MKENREPTPRQVWEEYEAGARFKAGLGERGLYEQNRMNERFFAGDQWHGARCGGDRPLVRHNVIKRIGEYKMAVVGAAPLAVRYTAEGIPSPAALREQIRSGRRALAEGGLSAPLAEEPEGEEIALVMSALSDYFRATAERVRFEEIRDRALRSAYCTGTGVVYTWWDERVDTGLYADEARATPIQGDIGCEVLDIDNVYFGDPSQEGVQEQPYILITQKRRVAELRAEAKKYSGARADIDAIRADDGWPGRPDGEAEATLITRFWKEWNGREWTVKAMKSCRGAVIRPAWDLGIRLYPLARFSWDPRRGCAYGESEITHLIPNQIAINRMLTASVWAVMMMGMPLMVVNGDIVQQRITNDPGQIIKIYGGAEETEGAVRYVDPPGFSPAFDNNIASLINNTLSQAGATQAALGDIRPDNTSAIIQAREAATLPLQTVQNRYYRFCEDIARIWAEFWVTMYGSRRLKIEDENGVWYLPFDGDRYRRLLISARVDVGASVLWSESEAIRTLENLFDRKVIDAGQYLERLPKGAVPDLEGLLRERRKGKRGELDEEKRPVEQDD